MTISLQQRTIVSKARIGPFGVYQTFLKSLIASVSNPRVKVEKCEAAFVALRSAMPKLTGAPRVFFLYQFWLIGRVLGLSSLLQEWDWREGASF